MPFDATSSGLGTERGDSFQKAALKHASKWMVLNALTVLKPAAACSLAYWEQGDPAMETEQAMRQRRQLRERPEVVAELRMWWDCALRSIQSRSSQKDSLERPDYMRLSRLLHKALISEWDEEDAEACAAEDWETDSAGLPMIGEERFMDCIFELVDVRCSYDACIVLSCMCTHSMH